MKQYKGYSLVEFVIAIGVFAAVASSVVFFSIEIYSSIYDQQMRTVADSSRQSIMDKVLAVKASSWAELIAGQGAGTFYLDEVNGKYTLTSGTSTQGAIAYSITVSGVNRDSNGAITQSGGTDDPHTKNISVNFTWTDKLGRPKNYTNSFYLNDWFTYKWFQTTKAEFDSGTFTQTLSRNNNGGEVELRQIFYPDWCKPTLAQEVYNIPGNATAKTLFSYPGTTYLGTGGSALGEAFTKLNITGVDTPTINVEGSFNGYTTNNIFVLGNYAYLATAQNDKEVIILDITSTPYTEVGYFNTSRTEDANSVYVVGNVGYVAAGRYVYAFNLTSKLGSRSQTSIKQVSLNQNFLQTASVSQIVVKNNYLFASLENDWYELAIVDVSNPANMQITSQTSVNNQQTLDVYVSDDSNRTYFGTGNSSSEREFFIIDTSSKTGARPTISSYDTSGMSVKGIAIVEADDRAILVGTGGQEYQVVDISNEVSLSKCGGMEYNSGINDIDAVTDSESNSFSYVVTNNSTQDFHIIRGGPGEGGGENGYGFLTSGQFTSVAFDSESSNSKYYTISWASTTPANTDLKFQVRSSNDVSMGSSVFVGPDGTSSSYFTNNKGSSIHSSISGKRYIQYKAFYTSDTLSTPILNSVTINYVK
jgi:hypothetical protein